MLFADRRRASSQFPLLWSILKEDFVEILWIHDLANANDWFFYSRFTSSVQIASSCEYSVDTHSLTRFDDCALKEAHFFKKRSLVTEAT